MAQITVITINYNNRDGLKDTLESIHNQSCKDFQYIVVDGGSTDGSADLLNEYGKDTDVCIIEPDRGIYDAMNKGVKYADGDYVMFVNSGDRIADNDTMAKLKDLALNSDICFCKVRNRLEDGKYCIWAPPSEDKLSVQFLRWNILHHPGALIKTELQKRIPYNINLRICADRQFFMQALINENASYETLDVILNEFAPAGTSGSNARQKMFEEDEAILDALFTERLLRDIRRSNWMTQQISAPLTHYYGKAKLFCRINRLLFKILQIK